MVSSQMIDRVTAKLGRKLYEAATVPKRVVLVEGGSHHSTNTVGAAQYRAALNQLFRMKTPAEPEADMPALAVERTPS